MPMNDDDQAQIKQLLKVIGELRLTQENLSVRIKNVEDWLRGSIDKRETRAENLGVMREEIKNLKANVNDLQKSDENLSSRFFQVWSGIFVSLVCAGLAYLFSKQ